MNARFDDVAKQARALSREEKEALVHALIEELDAVSQREAERLWVEEARRRLAEYRRGEVDAIPAEAVLAEARGSIR